MDLWLWALLLVVLAAVYLLWPRGRSINIKLFPRKYPDEKVSHAMRVGRGHKEG